MNDCVCELTGFCEVRQVALKVTYQMICRENKSRVDKILDAISRASLPPDTVVLTAIETATGNKISCCSCLQYLTTLRTLPALDCDEISENLAALLPLPHHIDTQCDTQQKRQHWLRCIVEAALLSWLDNLPLQLPVTLTTVNAEGSSSV